MAQFCTECGNPLAEGVAFCTECGAKVAAPTQMPEPVAPPEEEASSVEVAPQIVQEEVAVVTQPVQQPAMQMEEVTPPPVQQVPQQQVQYAPPVQQAPQQQVQYAPPVAPVPQQPVQPVTPKTEDVLPKGKYAVAGTGAYFGFMFLFGIPVIGWLVCFICAFAMNNKNLKNYAKSRVIWFFIKAVFWVGIYFLLRWVGNMIMDFIGGFFESEFGGLSDLFEQFKGLSDGLGELGDLSDSLGELGNLSDSLGNMEGLSEGLEGLENIPLQ